MTNMKLIEKVRLAEQMTTIEAETLDNWFKEKIKKYKYSTIEEELVDVYLMLLGKAICDDSLLTYKENKGE